MIRLLLTILLSAVAFLAYPQLIEKPLQQKKQHLQHRVSEAPDTLLNLPFWDDFSTSNGRPSPFLWKFGENVTVSNTIGSNAPTLGVAVLNGSDSLGIPYAIDDNAVSPVDSLVSQPINLTKVAINNRNSVFMSFFWQANGLGEIPDVEDSLSLCFLDENLEWISQDINPGDLSNNALIGGPDILRFSPTNPEEQIFTQIIIPVPEEFFHEGFRFKFQSYGSRQGSFDSWLIDYVYINFDRTVGDVFYEDRAIAQGISPTFGGYKTIPFEHFFDNQGLLSNTVDFQVNNLDNELQPLNFWVEVFDQKTGNMILTVNDESAVSPVLGANERRTVTSNAIDADNLIVDSDTTSLLFKTYIDSDDEPLIPNASRALTFLNNDTVYNELELERFYAYDDGSAEFSAGINVDGGKLVVKYGILTRDTLTAIDINFPIIFPDSERERIRVLVLRDLTDNPESMLIAQDFAVPPRISSNTFTRIPLKEQFILQDTIYIGIEQFSSDYIAIGLDKNSENGNKILFNLGELWERNLSVEGSLMIRPVFGTPFAPTDVKEDISETIVLYPNPAKDQLHISGNYDSFVLMDISGKQVAIDQIDDKQLNISGLEKGIYILYFKVGDAYQTKKFIKQ
ncbi:MAG: T9SS type A sorting domain-containing protein [Bacteroidota bacterium]